MWKESKLEIKFLRIIDNFFIIESYEKALLIYNDHILSSRFLCMFDA